MRIAFLASDKAREQLLADAFLMGARKHGHQTEVRTLGPDLSTAGFDVACLVGVKSKELFHALRAETIPTIYLDKGYTRHKRPGEAGGWEYWRVSPNAHHPTRLIDPATVQLPQFRLDYLNLELKPWRKPVADKAILIAGSSAKYHDFYGLGDPNEYAQRLVRKGSRLTDRPWIYRPKPSWDAGAPIDGASFSALPETVDDVLDRSHVLVTHGSNMCFEAVLRGVPCVVLGDAVAKPISSTMLEKINRPMRADNAARRQWLANLCFYQWTLAEMGSGACWDFLGEKLYA